MTKRGDHATTKATPGSAAGGIFNGVWEAMVEGVKYIFGSKTKPTSKSVSISSTSEFEQILAKRSNHPTTEGALGAAAEGIIEGVLEAIVDGVKYIFRAKHRPTAVDSSKSVPDSLTTVPGQKNGGEPGGDWSDRTPWIFYGVYMTKDETTKGKA